mgnify:CR=1 FL=1
MTDTVSRQAVIDAVEGLSPSIYDMGERFINKAIALTAINAIPSQPTQSDALREAVIEECAQALEEDAKLCDCAALEERECGCGAWCEWKSITSARAVEIVRALKGETK